jgi:hypothetical protein
MARAKKTQQRLPEMQDARLEELHNKLIELNAARTERMRLTKLESDLSEECIGLMRKYEKEESGYNFEGVEAHIEPPDGKYKIKVRIEHAEEEDKTKPSEVEHVSPQDGADFDEAASLQ